MSEDGREIDSSLPEAAGAAEKLEDMWAKSHSEIAAINPRECNPIGVELTQSAEVTVSPMLNARIFQPV